MSDVNLIDKQERRFFRFVRIGIFLRFRQVRVFAGKILYPVIVMKVVIRISQLRNKGRKKAKGASDMMPQIITTLLT
jgi:hypothetical protein